MIQGRATSIGVFQPVRPGAVNWMTAGHQVTHSERTEPGEREVMLDGHSIELGSLVVFDEGAMATVTGEPGARAFVLGGDALPR